MKSRILASVAAVSLMALGACNTTPKEKAAEAVEAQADNMEAMADSTSNVVASEMMENQADALDDKADDVRDGKMVGNTTTTTKTTTNAM